MSEDNKPDAQDVQDHSVPAPVLVADSVQDSVEESDGLCGFVPPTPGYLPCVRRRDREGEIGHEGPCAHPPVPKSGFAAIHEKVARQLHRGLRGWIRDWLHITSDTEQIVAYSNGLRRDHDALLKMYRELAEQHRDLTKFVTHNLNRRLSWYEIGPLRVSKIALAKKDAEREKGEKKRLAATNGDGAPHVPAPAPMDEVPEAERCGAVRSTDFGTFACQLRTGHEGDHQSQLENGQRAQWPDEPTSLTETSSGTPGEKP